MKILLTCGHLRIVGGVQRWVQVVADYLSQWHEITIAVRSQDDIGEFANLITCAKIITKQEALLGEDRYDIGIFAHKETGELLKFCKKTLWISHGTIGPEEPNLDADKLVCVSNEVREYWKNVFGRDVFDETILNPVKIQDIKTFPNDKIKNVLYVSPYPELKWIKKVCEEEGLNFKHARTEYDMDSLYRWADLVVSVGRGIYEAMSYGRVCITLDQRWHICKIPMSDGYTHENYPKSAIEYNCSGLYKRLAWRAEDFKWALKKYNGEFGKKNYELVKKYNNVEKICVKLLKLLSLPLIN